MTVNVSPSLSQRNIGNMGGPYNLSFSQEQREWVLLFYNPKTKQKKITYNKIKLKNTSWEQISNGH